MPSREYSLLSTSTLDIPQFVDPVLMPVIAEHVCKGHGIDHHSGVVSPLPKLRRKLEIALQRHTGGRITRKNQVNEPPAFSLCVSSDVGS